MTETDPAAVAQDGNITFAGGANINMNGGGAQTATLTFAAAGSFNNTGATISASGDDKLNVIIGAGTTVTIGGTITTLGGDVTIKGSDGTSTLTANAGGDVTIGATINLVAQMSMVALLILIPMEKLQLTDLDTSGGTNGGDAGQLVVPLHEQLARVTHYFRYWR